MTSAVVLAPGAPETARFEHVRRRCALLTFITHLSFILLALALSAVKGERLYEAPDTHTYVRPAEDLVHHAAYSREETTPFVWEPYRLPGYPVLIAFSLALSGQSWPVLLSTPFFAALATYALVGVSWRLAPSLRAAWATGIIAAFFPNSLGLSALMLTDAIAAYLLVSAFFFTVVVLEKATRVYHLWPALLWGMCQVSRPALALGGLFILGMALPAHARPASGRSPWRWWC